MDSPIKWVGSKKRICHKILEKFPKNFETYYELFAGSAVILFKLENKKCIISDINKELINFYEILKSNYDTLIKEVFRLEISEKKYYDIRSWDRDKSWPFDKMKRAVRFLYLNRNCYNGVWRVNSQDFFNVPWAKRKTIDYRIVCLKLASKFLQNVEIYSNDFYFFLNKITSNDLVYLDPPYAENLNCGDSKYTKKDFKEDEHLRLYEFCKELNHKKTKFVLSNSYSKEILELYKDFKIDVIDVHRCVGSLEKTRKIVQEVIITNI
jgi:DNA adenine methylase